MAGTWWDSDDWQRFLRRTSAMEKITVLEKDDELARSDVGDVIRGVAELKIRKRRRPIKVVFISCYVVTEGTLVSLARAGADIVVYESDNGLTLAAQETCADFVRTVAR